MPQKNKSKQIRAQNAALLPPKANLTVVNPVEKVLAFPNGVGESGTEPGNNKQGNKNRGGYRSRRSMGKTVGHFKCTSDSCGKTWSSIHAWTSRKIVCEICNGKAKVVRYDDEECELDNYYCGSCNKRWQSLHDNETIEQECDNCTEMVGKKAKTQLRNGRHFYYICLNSTECGVEWEDFWQGKVYSQRCTKCGSAGIMTGTAFVRRNVEAGGRGGIAVFGSGGSHNVDGCDMCQELRGAGIAGNCLRKRKVLFETRYDDAGNILADVVLAAN